jgi:hypothetical protein
MLKKKRFQKRYECRPTAYTLFHLVFYFTLRVKKKHKISVAAASNFSQFSMRIIISGADKINLLSSNSIQGQEEWRWWQKP